MSSPKVSIHILTYNHEKYIEQCLLSALNQDYDNLEVVVGDDDSSDGTVDIIKQIYQQYPKRLVPIVNAGHVGITENSNRVLSKCSGDLIAVTGGDDFLLPRKIAKQVNWMKANPTAVLCGHRVKILIDDILESGKGYESLVEHNYGSKDSIIRMGPPFPTLSIMYRSSCLPKYGFDSRVPFVSDWKLFLDVVQQNNLFGFLNEELAVYRKHQGSSTIQKKIAIVEDVQKVLNLLDYDEGMNSLVAAAKKQALLWKCSELHQENRFKEALDTLAQVKTIDKFSVKDAIRAIVYRYQIPYSWVKMIKRISSDNC